MRFVKMEGLGNDFVLTHGPAADAEETVISRIPFLCNRRQGIGADGVIFMLPSQREDCDFRMRIFNSDGTEAEMCGNGVRCVALCLHELGVTDKQTLVIETQAGPIRTERLNGDVRVDMGRPVLNAPDIPTTKREGTVVNEPLKLDDRAFVVTAVSMGNPHAVIYADDLTDDLVLGWGGKLERHPFFPNRVNVEFVKVLSEKEIRMRVFERGCGETMACGTGACAAVVAGVVNKKHDNSVTAHLPGGDLIVEWDGDLEHSVFLTGSARSVYHGDIMLEGYDL